jgi:hypothetical protein
VRDRYGVRWVLSRRLRMPSRALRPPRRSKRKCLLETAGAGVDVADLDEVVDDAVPPERDDVQIVESAEAHRRLGKGRSGKQQRHCQRGHHYL